MPDLQLYLASQSPRRRLLIEQLGLKYRTIDVEIDEQQRESEEPKAFVARLALEKARAGWQQVARQRIPVVSADTCIVINHRIIGKPADKQDGIALLQQYSGTTHSVLTGLAVVGPENDSAGAATVERVRVSTSFVTFRILTDKEIEQYWQTGEPLGKAGGYAIQGIAAAFIEKLEGSYSGVMGLPLCELAELMPAFGIQLFD